MAKKKPVSRLSKKAVRKPKKKEKCWFVYVIEAENGFLYAGITKDLERRFSEHSSSKKGAKFFRSSPPKKILYTENNLTLSKALKREHAIKKMSRDQKLAFISGSRPFKNAVLKRVPQIQDDA